MDGTALLCASSLQTVLLAMVPPVPVVVRR